MTLRFVLLGHPVAHSLSPAIHGAAYEALGFSHRYELLDIPDEAALARAVAALRAGEVAGANVTVPWKREALALADRREPTAGDVGAANVLVRDASGAVVAHNTDVMALVEELGALARAPERVLVLGAGGASVAAVAALRMLGARSIGISA
ncbi:MAG TPA: shikimate dehydrogenase, partial [Polyangiaceae bacterium]|nr:shikimate dehydrogenase [Polyangiaceae bacterium]